MAGDPTPGDAGSKNIQEELENESNFERRC